MPVVPKSSEELERMRIAGRLASEVLDFIAPHVKAGVTTGRLNDLCHEHMVKVQGTVPAPLNYAPPGYKPFPKSICTSVNHQVCHGVPGERVLKASDIVNIDITVIKDGYHGDCSRMFYVGEPTIQAKRLVDVTFECMWLGIRQVRPGARLGRWRQHHRLRAAACHQQASSALPCQALPARLLQLEPERRLLAPQWMHRCQNWTRLATSTLIYQILLSRVPQGAPMAMTCRCCPRRWIT